MSKITILNLLVGLVISPPICPVGLRFEALGAKKEITDPKWTTCDGSPSKLSVITSASVRGDLKKDGIICLFQEGYYLEQALIVRQDMEVKIGFVMVAKESVANTFVAYPGKVINTTDVFTLPLDPPLGTYKVLTRFYDEFGIERDCIIATFIIKEVPSHSVLE